MAKKLQNNTTEGVEDLLSKSTICASLTTYASEEQIIERLKGLKEAVKAAAWIYHDQDNKEPHIHLVILSNRSRRLSDFIGWFKDCKDENGKPVNTLAKVTKSTAALHKYFTHSDEDSQAEGKHQYTEEDIRVLEGDGYESIWDYKTKTDTEFEANQKRKAQQDDNEHLLNDILNGTPMREMARRYGRDYMKNFQSYHRFAAEVVIQEEGDIDKAMQIMHSNIENYTIEREKDAFQQGIRKVVDLCTERIDEGKEITSVLRALKQAIGK